MKKIITLVLAMMLAVTALAGCQKKEETAAPAVDAKDTFTVGFDQNFPPYGFLGDDGEFTGFDIEMAREAAKRMGKEIILKPIEWDAKDMELDTGAIDCIWNGFTINGREELYTWTDAYMDNSQVFAVRKDSGIATFADLAGKIVAAQTDSAALSALESEENAELKASFKELVVCGQYNAAFMDLEAGMVDAVALDIGVAEFQIEGKEDKFMILEQPLMAEQYGIGFKLGNTELRDQVQATLMEMVEDGTFAKISNEWFERDVCILGK